MALTSTNGTINGSDVTFSVSALQGAARGSGISAYIDYTKGTETVTLDISYNDAGLDSNYYNQVLVDGSNDIGKNTLGLPTTGKYKLPLEPNSNDDTVMVSVTGLVDGDLNIDFRIDNPYL